MRAPLLLLASSLCLIVASCATPKPPATSAATPASGTVLADARGMTLYTFDRDTVPGRSTCNGPCASNWPPLMATDGKPGGDWSVITRDDGSKQWAYKGKPLYTWVRDTKPGDTTGDGFNNVWKVARP